MAEIDINGILFNGPNNNGTAEHTNENGYQIGSLIYADNMNDDMRAIQTDLSKIYGMLLGKQVINYNLYDQSTTFKSTKIDWNRINTNINKIKTADITNGAITADKIASNAITTVKINNGAVTTDKLADNAVTSAKIANNTIKNEDIASDAAIAYSKLSLNNKIQETDIVNGAVTSDKIANGTIINDDINANAGIAKTKLALTDTLTNDDINANAGIAKTKLALTDTLTKADFKSSSFTDDGRIPSDWVDLSDVSVLDTSLGILNGTQSNGTARSYYVNNAVSTDYNKLLGTNASGAMTVVNVPVSKITNAVTSMNTTANTTTFKFPMWNAYGIITGTVTDGTAYKKQVTINGVNTTVFSGDDNFPETLVCPTTYGSETEKQYLCCQNNSLSWESLLSGSTTLKVNGSTYNLTGSGPGLSIYVPTSSGSRNDVWMGGGKGWTDLSSINNENASAKTLNIHGSFAQTAGDVRALKYIAPSTTPDFTIYAPTSGASDGKIVFYTNDSTEFKTGMIGLGTTYSQVSSTVSVKLDSNGSGIAYINFGGTLSYAGCVLRNVSITKPSGATGTYQFMDQTMGSGVSKGFIAVIGDTAHTGQTISVTVAGTPTALKVIPL